MSGAGTHRRGVGEPGGGPFSLERPRLGLAALLAVYLLLAHLYALKVPAGQGPDELAHLGYVQWLSAGRGLPVLGRAEGVQAPGYEAHQPPLYYLLAVPAYRLGQMAGPEGAARAVRLLSALLGAGSILCCFLLARTLWPDRPAAVWGAAAFIALLPSNTALMASANNDALMELVGTAFLLRCALTIAGRQRQPGLALGLLAGLGMWIKASCLILWVVGPLALWWAGRHGASAPAGPGAEPSEGARRHWRRQMAILLGVAALIAAPWLVRNQVLYGDPLGWQAFVSYFHSPPPPARPYPTPAYFVEKVGLGLPQYWQLVALTFLNTFLGILLGPKSLPLSLSAEAYWVFLLFLALALAGYMLSPDLRRVEASRRAQWVLWACLALALLAYVRLNASFFWAQARYVYLTLAAAACVWGAGLTAPLPPRYRPLSAGLAALFLLAMNLALLYAPLYRGSFFAPLP